MSQQQQPTKTATQNQTPLQQQPRGAAPLAKADPAKEIRDFLLANKTRIAETAAKHLNPDRLARIAAMTVNKSAVLGKCTPISILAAVMEAGRMGLEIGGALGHAYLVP